MAAGWRPGTGAMQQSDSCHGATTSFSALFLHIWDVSPWPHSGNASSMEYARCRRYLRHMPPSLCRRTVCSTNDLKLCHGPPGNGSAQELV